MKPIMRGRKSRRCLAVPFVMTAAFAPGCVVHSGPPPTSQPAHAQPATRGNDPDVRVVANPPPPATEARNQQTEAPQQRANRAEPKNWPPAPTGVKGKVMTREDGSCWFVYAVPTCPEGMACNPPRPKRVECADDSADDNHQNGRIVRSDDGTCWYHFVVDPDACPEKAVCNPPAPKKVDCPDED